MYLIIIFINKKRVQVKRYTYCTLVRYFPFLEALNNNNNDNIFKLLKMENSVVNRLRRYLEKIHTNLAVSFTFAVAGVLIAVMGRDSPIFVWAGILIAIVGFASTVNYIDKTFKNIQDEIKKSINPLKFKITSELDKAILSLVKHLLDWHKGEEYPVFKNLKIIIRLIKKEVKQFNPLTTTEWFEIEIEEEWHLDSQVTVNFDKLLPYILVCDENAVSKFSKYGLRSASLDLFYPIPYQLWKKYRAHLKDMKFLEEVKFTISKIDKLGRITPLKNIEYIEIRDRSKVNKKLSNLIRGFNKHDFSENFMYLLIPNSINISNSSYEWRVTFKCRYKLLVKVMENTSLLHLLNIYEYPFNKICSDITITFEIDKNIKDIVLEEPLVYLVSGTWPQSTCEPSRCEVKIDGYVFPNDSVVFRWKWQNEQSLQSMS